MSVLYNRVGAASLDLPNEGAFSPYRGITYKAGLGTYPNPSDYHVVVVDLSAPGLRFKVTGAGGTRDTLRKTTLEFMEAEKAQVAVNCHFFLPFPSSDVNSAAVGFAASLGAVISPFEPQPIGVGFTDQSFAIVSYAPALNIDPNNQASIVHRNLSNPAQVSEDAIVWNAVSGSAQIITNGVKTIPTYGVELTAGSGFSNSSSWYDLLRARTAIGLTKDSKKLVIFTCDGSSTSVGGTGGRTVGGVADILMRDFSVYNALNLDGGGSTTLCLRDPGTRQARIMNTSADNPLGRSVATNLAIFAIPW